MENCTEEQRACIEAVLKGHSIFITGPGGTGKSYILDILYKEFTYLGKKMAITAMTGCAALLIGAHAKTLHSWAGIGLGREPLSHIVSAIHKNGRKKNNWKKTDCLVIDEVSMMTPQILSLLNDIGKSVRKCYTKPFGGLQIVFVGDFYQLPPVCKTGMEFAFQSPIWKEVVEKTCVLTIIHRQKDPVFQKVLEEARRGELSDESYQILLERKSAKWKGNAIRPTMLFTRNDDINAINQSYLDRLVGDVKEFVATTESPPKANPDDIHYQVQRLDKDAPYEPTLRLKVGAQVMLLAQQYEERNEQMAPIHGLVNGSRGVVVDFTPCNNPIVKFVNGRTHIIKEHTWASDETESAVKRKQIPLRLAYALTIHKAQGASLDSALIDVGSATFEYGQAYVALSRVRSLDALYIHDVEKGAFRVHPAVAQFYQNAYEENRIFVDPIQDAVPV
jgi:ATP-dependent DNA helicase PIF1